MAETDEEIYRRYLAQGSENDLRALLLRHREGLTLFSAGIVGNLDDAEEVMLDAFAVVASGTSYLRKRRFFPEPIPDQADESLPSSDFGILREERNRTLYEALGRLAPEYRQVLFLTFFEEMDTEEVARIMRKTPKQVYNLTYRGKQALKETLERMGFSDEID